MSNTTDGNDEPMGASRASAERPGRTFSDQREQPRAQRSERAGRASRDGDGENHPDEVAERLSALQRLTGADELVVTSVTHDHDDRLRSHELLAKRWGIG